MLELRPPQRSTRVENHSRSCRAARWSRREFDAIAETSQFADHLARSHLLSLFTDGWAAFLIANALMKNLPNQPTEPVGDGTNGLTVSESRDEPSVDDGEDRALRFDRGIRRLVEDAAHLPVAL